jgi:SAM-dependent methyltransferase
LFVADCGSDYFDLFHRRKKHLEKQFMDLKEIELLGPNVGEHWYYRSKFGALARWIDGLSPRHVLDVGAGTGFFARELLSTTGAAAATCVDPGYPADRDEQVGGKPLHFRRVIAETDADLVLLMDVLEHVDDDAGLLREYVQKASPEADLVITVPAFGWLWSDHDVFLEHRRRYTLRQVEDVVRDAGLVPERGAYFFGAVFPLAAAVRMAGAAVRRARGGAAVGGSAPRSQMRRHGPLANATLFGLCAAELPLFRFNRLGGLTAFVHARRKRH